MTTPCAGEHVASVERISHPSALLHPDGESELSSHAATWCQVWRNNNPVDHRIIFAFLVFFLPDVEMTKRAVRTTNQWSGLCIFIRWCLCYSQSDKSRVNRRSLIARRHLFVSVSRRATPTHLKEMQFNTRCNLTCGRSLEDINSKTSNNFLIASCSFLLVLLISLTYNIESIYKKNPRIPVDIQSVSSTCADVVPRHCSTAENRFHWISASIYEQRGNQQSAEWHC